MHIDKIVLNLEFYYEIFGLVQNYTLQKKINI